VLAVPTSSADLSSSAVPADQVEIRRSTRRRRTVSAYRDGDRIVVLVPARLPAAEEARLVRQMVDRLNARAARSGRTGSDAALQRRALELSRTYLEGRAVPVGVRWVPEMRTRWASCTPSTRMIRLSERLRELPEWVQDYVLVHELTHLLVPGHGPRFWALVERYPRTERARGYLDGVSAAAGLGFTDDLADDSDDRAAQGGRAPEPGLFPGLVPR
jgi:predicted metal-dependent hydrolase